MCQNSRCHEILNALRQELLNETMHELDRDVTPVGYIQDHDVTKDVMAYLLQFPVKWLVSVLEVDSRWIFGLLKHGVL